MFVDYEEWMEIDKRNTSSDLTYRFTKLSLNPLLTHPSRTSDRIEVNNKSGDNARMNCYLTAIVGNSRLYQLFGVKYFAQQFNITQTNTKTIEEISSIYTNPLLGQQEGYRPYLKFDSADKCREYINNKIDECVETKFIFVYHLSDDYKRKVFEELRHSVDGHIVSLKIRQKKSENERFYYMFIDYQQKYNRSNNFKRYTVDKLPKGASKPFYLFEKIQY